MLRKIFTRILLLGALVLASCGSTHYKVTLKDGRELNTASKPEYSAKTGYYRYKALNGKDELVRADEVLMMSEL
jgi:hypothetical protein